MIPILTLYHVIIMLRQLVDGKVFCVHGGLSPVLRTVDQIQVDSQLSRININININIDTYLLSDYP